MSCRVHAVHHQGCHTLNCIESPYKFINSVCNSNELFLAVALLVLAVALLISWIGTHDFVHTIAHHISCLISEMPRKHILQGEVKGRLQKLGLQFWTLAN